MISLETSYIPLSARVRSDFSSFKERFIRGKNTTLNEPPSKYYFLYFAKKSDSGRRDLTNKRPSAGIRPASIQTYKIASFHNFFSKVLFSCRLAALHEYQ